MEFVETLTFFATGRFNRLLGWTMLIGGMAIMSILDPWIFFEQAAEKLQISVEQDTEKLLETPLRMQLRHAQGVILAMALLQLVVGYVLTTKAFQSRFSIQSSILTGVGAILYASGYTLQVFHPVGKWLILFGCSLNLLAFLKSLRITIGGSGAKQIKLILPILCFGMFLDLLTSLFILDPNLFFPEWLREQDEVRLRMLRLARVAVIALTVLVLLYFDLAYRARNANQRIVVWGHRGLLGGTIGMPLVLALACFIDLHLKYLLPIPATLVCLGSCAGLNLAWKHGARLEWLGWLIITASLFTGMLIGMYAFNGPLPAPWGMEHYQDFARRLLRIGHAYAIVLGILTLFLAQRFQQHRQLQLIRRLGVGLYLLGMGTTLLTLALFAWANNLIWATAVGPAVIALGLLLCVTNVRSGSQPVTMDDR